MNEWTVVSVIVVLIGLFFTVGKPVLNLNTTLVRLEERLKGFERTNDAEHLHINSTLERHEDTLEEHELRLNKLDGK